MKTLKEDFDGWWTVLKKYTKIDIEARDKYGNKLVYERIADSSGKLWPGPEEGVQYFVRLENNVYVGFREVRNPETGRRAKYAEFPVYEGEKNA